MNQEHSAKIRAAYQQSKVRSKKLLKLFQHYSKAVVYKYAKKPLNGDPVLDKRKLNKEKQKEVVNPKWEINTPCSAKTSNEGWQFCLKTSAVGKWYDKCL